jgi:hypothetical protein
MRAPIPLATQMHVGYVVETALFSAVTLSSLALFLYQIYVAW